MKHWDEFWKAVDVIDHEKRRAAINEWLDKYVESRVSRMAIGDVDIETIKKRMAQEVIEDMIKDYPVEIDGTHYTMGKIFRLEIIFVRPDGVKHK
jgi:hypothetical protein